MSLAFLTTYRSHGPYQEKPLIALFAKSGMLITIENLYGGEALVFQPWMACIAAILCTVLIA